MFEGLPEAFPELREIMDFEGMASRLFAACTKKAERKKGKDADPIKALKDLVSQGVEGSVSEQPHVNLLDARTIHVAPRLLVLRDTVDAMIRQGDWDWLKKAEVFLADELLPCDSFGDGEALVYLISRGIPCRQHRSDMIDHWREAVDRRVEEFAKPKFTTVCGDNDEAPKQGEMIREGVPDDQARDVLRWSSMKLWNFWSWHDCQEATIDATMLRVVEWAGVGGFDEWWQRLAKEMTECIAHGGVGDLDAAYRIFALARSDYALRLLGPSMVQYLWSLTVGTNRPTVPWNVLVDCGMETRPRDSLVIPSAIVFGAHRIKNESVATDLLDNAIRFIRGHQQASGGWSMWADSDVPDIETTAMALHAICVARPLGWEHAAATGAEWLRTHQDSYGSWAEAACPDAAYLTVLVLDAIELADGGTGVTFRMDTESAAMGTEGPRMGASSAGEGRLPIPEEHGEGAAREDLGGLPAQATDDLRPEEPQSEDEWSKPMSLTEMASRLWNMDRRKFKRLAERNWQLEKRGRQSFVVRLDLMNPTERQRIEKGASRKK